MSTLNVSCHLIISAKVEPRYAHSTELTFRGKPGVRCSIGKPSLRPDEIAIAMNLSLPLALFVRPQLTASLVVPAEAAPFTITPRIEQNIAEQIRAQTGFAVRLEIAAPAEEKA